MSWYQVMWPPSGIFAVGRLWLMFNGSCDEKELLTIILPSLSARTSTVTSQAVLLQSVILQRNRLFLRQRSRLRYVSVRDCSQILRVEFSMREPEWRSGAAANVMIWQWVELFALCLGQGLNPLPCDAHYLLVGDRRKLSKLGYSRRPHSAMSLYSNFHCYLFVVSTVICFIFKHGLMFFSQTEPLWWIDSSTLLSFSLKECEFSARSIMTVRGVEQLFAIPSTLRVQSTTCPN